MIIPVTNVQNSDIYAEHNSLQATRYRYDLSIGQTPRNLIILLRVGEFSRSGHYTILDYKATLPEAIENIRQRTPSNDSLVVSELSIVDLGVYSL